jgi:hypothetical protein
MLVPNGDPLMALVGRPRAELRSLGNRTTLRSTWLVTIRTLLAMLRAQPIALRDSLLRRIIRRILPIPANDSERRFGDVNSCHQFRRNTL